MTLLLDTLLIDPAANLLLGLSLLGLTKQVLLTALAVLNGILALLATLAVWKSYLLVGAKMAMTAVILIPVVGIFFYFLWGQKKVRESR